MNFIVDYNLLIQVLTTIVIMSFFIERSLSVIFGSEFFLKWYDPTFAQGLAVIKEINLTGSKKSGIKELISIIVSISFVIYWEFDAITILFETYDTPQPFGYVVSGLIIAGGSKASIKLFQEVLGFHSSAEKRRKKIE